MSDKLLVEIDLLNNRIEDALPGLVFLTNELYEAGLFEVGARSNWEEKEGFDYKMKWRCTEEDEFVETIPVEDDFLLQLKSLCSKLNAEDESSNERKLFIQKRLDDLIKSADMTILCDRAA